jgi:enoyl-CoA hydratase
LESQQILSTIMDGVARHTPEGVVFKKRCEKVGFKQAVLERDQDDASQLPKAKL